MARRVFYLENDENDFLLLKRALSRLGVSDRIQMEWFRSSPEVFRVLEEGDLPAMMLLDLRLNGESGLEVLQLIRNNANCSKIPVFLFSSGKVPSEMVRSLEGGAAGYISKPPDFEGLLEVARLLAEYLEPQEAAPLEPLS
jgi:CheY-like chemotaxis protein